MKVMYSRIVEKRERRLFTYLTVSVLSTPTFYMLLERAGEGFACIVMVKVVPQDATSKDCNIISMFNCVR